MDRIGYARGLVKYSTDNAMKQGWSQSQTLRHVFRPRVLVYSAILGSIVLAMLVSLNLRTLFKVDVVRDRGVMARIVDGANIENVYRLQVMNATESGQHYRISASGMPGLKLTTDNVVLVASTEARWVTVRLQVPLQDTTPGSHPIAFEIESLDAPGHLTEKSVFLVPR
jgi:polyferredoxin